MLIYKARENSSVGNGTVPLKKIIKKNKIKGWGGVGANSIHRQLGNYIFALQWSYSLLQRQMNPNKCGEQKLFTQESSDILIQFKQWMK